MPHEVVVMSVSEAIWGTLKMVVIDVFVKLAVGVVLLLFTISWLLSL